MVCLGRDFANATTPQPRNGGLIGLAACAIALGKVGAQSRYWSVVCLLFSLEGMPQFCMQDFGLLCVN